MPQKYKDLSDEELTQLAIFEDKRALKELLYRIQKDISVFLHYYDPDFIAENDLTQIILVKISNNIKYLKTPLTIKKWTHKIIINAYYDYIRKINMMKRKINYDLTNEQKREKAKIIEDKHINPNDEILNKELKDKIQGAIMKLPKNHRLIVLLRDFAGLSYEDIESILGINQGTVKSRLARARNKLKQDLRYYL